jgi:hypothetical protein
MCGVKRLITAPRGLMICWRLFRLRNVGQLIANNIYMFAILDGAPINVGELIANNIYIFASGTKKIVPHLSLIC